MKTLIRFFFLLSFTISLASCGVNNAMMFNSNQISTEIHLASNNYHIIDHVYGHAQVPYVLFFGGMNKTQLFENAYADMLAKANLSSGSKALINVITEEHIGGVPPFYYKRTVTVSAHVIEFTN